MSNTFNVLIYARRTKTNQQGLCSINLRVTVDGARFDTSTGRVVDVSRWSQQSERLQGSTKEILETNDFFNLLRVKAFNIQKKFIALDIPLTIEEFKKEWFGVKEKSKMLLEIYQEHNNEVEQLVGSQYSKATWKKYNTSLLHTQAFLKNKYSINDIEVKQIQYKFITDFEFWLKIKRNCNHNSTIKYLTNFKKIIHICLKNSWLEKDPFIGFKMSKQDVEPEYLTEEELQNLASKEFVITRLTQVRDIFLFCCFTGLAYADVYKLTRSQILKGIDGEQWIFTHRQKTDTASRIPLLPTATAILDRYENDPQCIIKGKILPVPTNQKMNGYLKEIADLCGINKYLTTHMARHTFATTVTLTNGVPMETVSKMLGHKNLRTTQHYARILDKKVSEDMKALRVKLMTNTKV